MELPTLLVIVNCVASLFMVGLIWMVQIAHYPLFSEVGEENFVAFHKRHQTLTTLVVGPPMLIEALSSGLLFWYPPAGVNHWLISVGIGLVFLIWFSTAAIQLPCHGKLVDGFDQATHRRLVRSNWIRTVAWTARGILTIWMLVCLSSVA